MVSAPDSLVGEMTITKVISGHHQQLSLTSCFVAHQYIADAEPGHLKVFSINELVEYYKSCLLLT